MKSKSLRYVMLSAAMAFLFGAAAPAAAELDFVSPGIDALGDPAAVALFPDSGWSPGDPAPGGDFRGARFPLWYQDANGLQLTLCLDGEEEEFPCAWEGAPVFTDSGCTDLFYPYEEIVGFGDEAFYFKAQSYPFDVPLTGPAAGGSAQLQLLLETTWTGDVRFDAGLLPPLWIEEEGGACRPAVVGEDDLHRVEPGYEMLFTRARLRVLPGSPEGWYRMTHPYGVKTVFHPADPDDDPGDDRTEVRQVIGDLVVPPAGWIDSGIMPDYTIALNDPDTLIARFGPVIALDQYIGLRDFTGYFNDEAAGLKSIGPFLYKPDYLTDPNLRIEDPDGTVRQYIGYPANEADPAASPGHKVLGSPVPDGGHDSGFQNYFRIEFQAGVRETPPNPGAWVQVGFTDDFNVVGKVANCGPGNLAPVAEDDLAATPAETPVTIHVLANDHNDVAQVNGSNINPVTVAIVTPPADPNTAVANPDGTVTFTPGADVAGPVTFQYTVQDFCGLTSNPATVTVLVDDIQVQDASYRIRFGRWSVRGISSFVGENVRVSIGPRAFMDGAQEVPAVVTDGGGYGLVVVNQARDAIEYTMTYQGLTAVTQAHIHNGAPGVNGPVNIFLCTNLDPPGGVPAPPACPEEAGSVSGTLTAEDFISAGAVTTFDAFIDAILDGGTYINVHTLANPGGEIRGQIERHDLFTATVQAGGVWQAQGKSSVAPGPAPRNIVVQSIAGGIPGVIDNVGLQIR